MEFELQMKSGNAAFSDGNTPAETARILREVADRVERGDDGGVVRDGNGNSVGNWHLSVEEAEDDTEATDAEN